MLTVARIAFGAFFLSVVVLVHVYIYRRVVRDLTHRLWLRRAAVYAFVVASGSAIAMRTLFRGATTAWVFAFALPLWLGFVLHLLLSLGAGELVRAFVVRRVSGDTPESEARRTFLKKAIAVSAAGAAGGFTALGTYRAYAAPVSKEIAIALPRLPKALEGFRLVQLTDVHIGTVIQERFVDDMVERAMALKPDLIALTGDLVDGQPEYIGRFVARLARLNARYGKFFVTGNHDYYSGADAWVRELEGLDFTVLRNRRVTIGDAGGSFELLGVDDFGHRYTDSDYDLEKAAQGLGPDAASVLLAHQPAGFEGVADKRIGLQISGHTHGGQTFPITIGSQLVWGDRSAGLSRTLESQLFVSRGVGFVGPPLRLGSPPEIPCLVLTAA